MKPLSSPPRSAATPELTIGAPTSSWISSLAPTFAVLRPPVRPPPSSLSSGACSVFFRAPECSPGHRRRAAAAPPPAPAVSPPASLMDSRGRPIGTDGSDLKGAYPFDLVHGGPVDQVHRAGPRPRVMLVSAPANHSPPRGTPSAPPPAAFTVLQKEPQFLEFTTMSFHLQRPLCISPDFHV
jgi:hypothetical protein